MKRVMCSVYDSASQLFGTPFFVPHTNAAIRSFSDEVNRAADDNQLYQHTTDFVLHEIAVFDDTDGSVEFTFPPRVICRAVDIKNPPNSAV